jgi:hypothetical protein
MDPHTEAPLEAPSQRAAQDPEQYSSKPEGPSDSDDKQPEQKSQVPMHAPLQELKQLSNKPRGPNSDADWQHEPIKFQAPAGPSVTNQVMEPLKHTNTLEGSTATGSAIITPHKHAPK